MVTIDHHKLLHIIYSTVLNLAGPQCHRLSGLWICRITQCSKLIEKQTSFEKRKSLNCFPFISITVLTRQRYNIFVFYSRWNRLIAFVKMSLASLYNFKNNTFLCNLIARKTFIFTDERTCRTLFRFYLKPFWGKKKFRKGESTRISDGMRICGSSFATRMYVRLQNAHVRTTEVE